MKTEMLGIRLFLCFWMLMVWNVDCDGQQRAEVLKTDPALVKGTLRNGVSYYIRDVAQTRNQVKIQLVVKVGSGNEAVEETEFSHLIEHLAFEGTDHFPEDSARRFFAAHGLVFGSDVNAYTSIFNTGYFLNLPTADTSLMSDCFVLVRDWMHYLAFDSARITAQVGAVLGEMRMKGETAASQIMYEKDSRVLGIPDYGNEYIGKARRSLTDCSRNDLLKYYNKWYRPDLQAIIVVGDVDADLVERKIKRSFSSLLADAQKGPGKRAVSYCSRPVYKDRVIHVTSPNVLVPSLEVYFKRPTRSNQLQTRADYQRHILEQLTDRLLQKRFSMLPHAYGKVDINAALRTNMSDSEVDAIVVSSDLRDVKGIENCFKSMMSTFLKVVDSGFTEGELSRVRAEYSQTLESADAFGLQRLSERYRNNYLSGLSIPGPQEEQAIVRQLLDRISLADVNIFIRKWAHRNIGQDILMVTSRDELTLPTKRDFARWILQVRKNPIVDINSRGRDPLLYLAEKSPLKNDSLTHGYEETWSSDSAMVFLKLKNGASVVIRPDKDSGRPSRHTGITMTACSAGGFSRLNGSERFLAENAADLVHYCGAGDLDRFQLEELIEKYNLHVNPYVDDDSRQMNGHCQPEHFDAMLQLVYLFFMRPRVDDVAFEDWKSVKKLDMRHSQLNSALYIQSLMNTIPFGRSPESRGIFDSIGMRLYLDSYKRQFSGAGDFTFFFSGAFHYDARFRDTMLKWLGAISAGLPFNGPQRVLTFSSEPYQMADTLDVVRHVGSFNKAEVRLLFPGRKDLPSSTFCILGLKIICDVLQQRIFTRLRTVEGGAYSPGASLNFKKVSPDSISYRFVVSFDSDPNGVNNMVRCALQELRLLQEKGMSKDEFLLAVANIKATFSMQENGESYARRLMNEFLDSGVIREPVDQIQNINSVKYEQINNFCRAVLTEKLFQKFVVIPQEF